MVGTGLVGGSLILDGITQTMATESATESVFNVIGIKTSIVATPYFLGV